MKKILKLTYANINATCELLLDNMRAFDSQLCHKLFAYPIPRGGVHALQSFNHVAAIQDCGLMPLNNPRNSWVLFDDIVDSGETILRVLDMIFLGNRNSRYVVLALYATQSAIDRVRSVYYDRVVVIAGEILPDDHPWIEFPWESDRKEAPAEDAVVRLLQAIGEDPTREGLKETPKRLLKAFSKYFEGYHQKVEDFLTVFKDGAEGSDEMIVVHNIPIHSHCEHHIAPFNGVAHIAYIPHDGKIVGLSKLPRIANMFMRRLQVQERLTNQIADAIVDHLSPHAAVYIRASHSCMTCRGIAIEGGETSTTALRGAFKDQLATRQEFFDNIKLATK